MRNFQTIGIQIYRNKWISVPITEDHKALIPKACQWLYKKLIEIERLNLLKVI